MTSASIISTPAIKRNFRFDIPDNGATENFQWQVQSVNIPSVSITQAHVTSSPKLANTLIPGTATEFSDLQVTFLVEEDYASYIQLYRWLLTLQNPDGPTTEDDKNVPRTGLIHIMDNTQENVLFTFKFDGIYVKMLAEMELNTTQSTDEPLTCTAFFAFIKMSLLDANGNKIAGRPFSS